MARMYPKYIPEKVDSPGERVLFHKFRNDLDTKNWIVLHSLFVADHPERISGEIDYVAIIPNHGVLCLEVKAGKVARKDGVWIYGDGSNAKKSKVSPFAQASDSMHKIRNYLFNADPTLKNLLFFSGVLFTSVSFDDDSPEWHKWQYADRSTFSRKPISRICVDMLKHAHAYISNTPSTEWYDNQKSRPSPQQAERILELLRGDFEYFISPDQEVIDIEKSIKKYTQEQFKALDLLAVNERILYTGPAGTGKTLLALEATRRSILSGNRTLFLCYNNLLGGWISKNAKGLAGEESKFLEVGTLHKFLLSISGLAPSNSPDFWQKELPNMVIDKYLSGEITIPMFKFLVIDEAQDITVDEYLDVLDLILEGGISSGHWAMFGDFERQAIYKRNSNVKGDDLEKKISDRSPHYTKFPLRVNCRNNETIAIGLELSCNLKPGYSDYLHVGSVKGVEPIFFFTKGEQITALRNLIRQLTVTEKFLPEDIIILSYKRDNNCAAKLLEEIDEEKKYVPIRKNEAEKEKIKYSTIHAFKGLESPVVVITDIDRISGEQYESLLYVGMSRARVRLILLMHGSCMETWKEILKNTFLD